MIIIETSKSKTKKGKIAETLQLSGKNIFKEIGRMFREDVIALDFASL